MRWGGLFGLLSGGFALVFLVVNVAIGQPALVDPEEQIMRFPDSRVARAVGPSLGTLAVILQVVLFLALYRALRGTSLAPALFGSVLGVLGIVAIGLGLTSAFVAFAPLSDLYHASGATAEQRATVVLLWQATEGVQNTFFGLGNLFVSIGLIALGVAMLRAPGFGQGFGWVSVVLGVAGVAGVYASLAVLPAIAAAFFANLVFVFLFGWKAYSLSMAPAKE